MFNELNAELAVVFAHYAECRDPRIAFLGRKADHEELTDAEMTEYINRIERQYKRFRAECAALLGKKG